MTGTRTALCSGEPWEGVQRNDDAGQIPTYWLLGYFWARNRANYCIWETMVYKAALLELSHLGSHARTSPVDCDAKRSLRPKS